MLFVAKREAVIIENGVRFSFCSKFKKTPTEYIDGRLMVGVFSGTVTSQDFFGDQSRQ